MQEKRKTKRIKKTLVAQYFCESNPKASWDSTCIKNISEEGLLFTTNKQFAAGDILQLMFKIPLDPLNWVKTQGKVINSTVSTGDSFLTRIEFTGLNESQKKLMRDYVDWFLRDNSASQEIDWQNENRKAPRIQKDLITMYGMQNNQGLVEKWDTTLVKNFSEIGMGFITTSSFSRGDKIDFMIKIPTHPFDWLRLYGKVIESVVLKGIGRNSISQTYLTRAEFIDIKDEEKKLIQDYITWFLNKKEEAK